jgi:hypothetical protein
VQLRRVQRNRYTMLADALSAVLHPHAAVPTARRITLELNTHALKTTRGRAHVARM